MIRRTRNSTQVRLESIINSTAIENVGQSAKDRTHALTNRLNGNVISKTSGKIAEILEKLTTQQ